MTLGHPLITPQAQASAAPAATRRPLRWLLAAMLLLSALYGHWLVFRWGPAEQQLWLSNALFTFPLVPAIALGWCAAARQRDAARRGWVFVALAITFYLLGTLMWSYLQRAFATPPFPSLADALYLCFTPCMALAFLSFPRPRFAPMEALRLGLDTAIIVAALGVYAWYFMFAPTILAYPGQPLARAVALAYPLGDQVLLSLLLLMVLRQRQGQGLQLETLLLGIALLLLITGDTLYFFGLTDGSYTNGSWYNGLLVGGNVLLALAAYASLTARPLFFWQRPAWAWPRLYLPYIAVLASYGLMLARGGADASLAATGVQWGTALVTLLVIVRQLVTFAENTRLNRALQANGEALEAAKNVAQSANRAKSSFLSAMSHELRTPLNAMLGYSQLLLQDGSLSARQSRGLATIQSSGQHLLLLINEILDLSKVEAGKLELAPAPIQLASFLAVISDIISIKAEKKGLLFQCEVPAPLPLAIQVDEQRLRQVLLNLLGNAVKFTDQGQVRLRVSEQSRGDAEVSLRFEVIDSGVGIAPEQLEAIFQPFEQVGELARRAGGTGLGLAISRQLVRLLGAEIGVESQLGQGSCFSFELRLPLAAAPEARQACLRVSGYEGPRRTLLVVDDVAENRSWLLDWLGGLGFEVLMAENGEQALQVAVAKVPDLILMDMLMPVLDGLAATRRARALPALQGVPILIVSASASQADRAEALAAGADGFISKPIEQSALLQALAALLALRWQAALPDAAASPDADAVAGPLRPPPLAELTALHQLARAGNLSELRLRTEQLAAQHPGCRLFAEQLGQLAAGFKSKAVLGLIEAHLTVPLGEQAQP
jgi:signal transduction histidine kinase/CheY-like chemotaxis protein